MQLLLKLREANHWLEETKKNYLELNTENTYCFEMFIFKLFIGK